MASVNFSILSSHYSHSIDHCSRYSPKVQRLTAHRSLQVLATLFLLCYTKLLLAISQVLFAFSLIVHLPSQHTKIVWSPDASIKVFGIKFCALFIVCFIIFLFLLATIM